MLHALWYTRGVVALAFGVAMGDRLALGAPAASSGGAAPRAELGGWSRARILGAPQARSPRLCQHSPKQGRATFPERVW